jgi:hypothetical protein
MPVGSFCHGRLHLSECLKLVTLAMPTTATVSLAWSLNIMRSIRRCASAYIPQAEHLIPAGTAIVRDLLTLVETQAVKATWKLDFLKRQALAGAANLDVGLN